MLKFCKEHLCLYAVTDRQWINKQSLYEQVKDALEGEVTLVQLREKELDEMSFILEVKMILELCHQYNVPLIINDKLNVALSINADGIHLGQDDLSCKEVKNKYKDRFIVEVSCHNVKEELKANRDRTMFSTSTKKNVQSLNLALLKDSAMASSCPVVTIGGINEHNMHHLKKTKIAGVAFVSAIFASDAIKAKCQALKRQIKSVLFDD